MKHLKIKIKQESTTMTQKSIKQFKKAVKSNMSDIEAMAYIKHHDSKRLKKTFKKSEER